MSKSSSGLMEGSGSTPNGTGVRFRVFFYYVLI